MNAKECPEKQRLADYTSGKLSEEGRHSLIVGHSGKLFDLRGNDPKVGG